MKIFCILLGFCMLTVSTFAQNIKVLSSGEKTSIRGLSVVSDKIVWVSGSNGMIGRSVDGGNTWKWSQVKDFEKTDFRDIEAFDASTAIIMGIAEPAYILKTIDAGETWKVVYENKTKGMFLDAMDFRNDQNGIIIGDPIDKKPASPAGRIFIATTVDGGNSWQDMKQNAPVAYSGEACFASSGTNIRMFDSYKACFITGGLRSRLFIGNNIFDLPVSVPKIRSVQN